MKKVSVLLCGLTMALLTAGCGEMPDLTQEETDLIAEYAAGMLLKYDRDINRLVDTSMYEEEVEEEVILPEEAEEPTETEEEESTSVVDVSQDEETEPAVSSVEQYYGVPNVMIAYTGYEVTDSYPPSSEGEDLVFSMEASSGTQLLVLKFNAQNLSGEDQVLNMLGYGARFRVSVNGESSKGALATMLVNDMQTYNDVIPANSAVELVSIVEIPQGTNVGSIDMILRGGEQDATLRLQ
ncbi:MAG: hypothetical protein HDR05_12340 [Lachnospiraceae bacterium]|nr:hypothetical protein [Lachnospiraceae bacterium]